MGKRKTLQIDTTPKPSRHQSYPRAWEQALLDAYNNKIEKIEKSRREYEERKREEDAKELSEVECLKIMVADLQSESKHKDMEIRVLETSFDRAVKIISTVEKELQRYQQEYANLQATNRDLSALLDSADAEFKNQLREILKATKQAKDDLEEELKVEREKALELAREQLEQEEKMFLRELDGLQHITRENVVRMKHDNHGVLDSKHFEETFREIKSNDFKDFGKRYKKSYNE